MAFFFAPGSSVHLGASRRHPLPVTRRQRRTSAAQRSVPRALVRGEGKKASRPPVRGQGKETARPSVHSAPAKVTRERSAPPEWWLQPMRLPLALELDFLLNHPIAEVGISGLVLLSCVGFALTTTDLGGQWNAVPRYIEHAIGALFTAEYFLRWYSHNLSPRFLLTRAMLIDFCAIVPLFVDLSSLSSNSVFVRILRLTRILRLQRMMEEEAQDMFGDLTTAQVRIVNVFLTVFSILYVSAGLFFDVEHAVNPEVNTFFDAFYFATVTLFTVGFGDVTPLTPTGRLITVLTVMGGAVLIPFQLAEVERARRSVKGGGVVRMGDGVVPTGFVPMDFSVEVSGLF